MKDVNKRCISHTMQNSLPAINSLIDLYLLAPTASD